MKSAHNYFVYVLTGHSRRLYVGVTNDLLRRVQEHKQKLIPGFTSRYAFHLLVHYEQFSNINDAIAREKQIKGWSRDKKIALIEAQNPGWVDLSENW
jgi:putative endonuclease